MDLDRPHFRTTSIGSSSSTTTTTSELFICFTSRLSSSSMKLSKSILSPGRAARDGGGAAPNSLSSSLSRRLRTNGSIKNGQASPFFATGKKRGCGFENPEPSSPKVTCIGQVRVKTKKKVKQTRSLSRRRSGEVSFRKIEQVSVDGEDNRSVGSTTQQHGSTTQQQQRYSNASAHYQHHQHQQQHQPSRWVHLPVSICEALRAFGAEFSCLFPCKSSCFSNNERDKGEKESGNSENGCGAVFTRWLVSVNDGEGGKRREIELVVGGGDEVVELEESRMSMRSSRRHVFDDIEVKDDRVEVKGEVEVEEGGRVSVCVPPKNALLLMRCRSDPMKMADLANRFSWDANAVGRSESEVIVEEGGDCKEGGGGDEDFEEQIRRCEGGYEGFEQDCSVLVEGEHEIQVEQGMEVGDSGHGEELVITKDEMVEEKEQEDLQGEMKVNVEALAEAGEQEQHQEDEDDEEEESNMSSFEALLDQENEEVESRPICRLSTSTELDEQDVEINEVTTLVEEVIMENETDESNIAEKDSTFVDNNDEEIPVTDELKPEPETTHQEEEEEQTTKTQIQTEQETENPDNQELAISNIQETKEKESPVLPDCLLLMMCEPKLSMEVSKETWVCHTDFLRWLPERPRKAAAAAKSAAAKPGACEHHEPVKRRLSIDSKPKPTQKKSTVHQPPRSSCTLPAAAASMATMIEQKLVNAVGYEPFVLKRCKSEPMRTAAAKLVPESCFWKNGGVGKLEPHRVGVGAAAGVGC